MTRVTVLFLLSSLFATALILLSALGWSRPDLIPDLPWFAIVVVAWLVEGVSWYYALRLYGERGKLGPQDRTMVGTLWICGVLAIAAAAVWASLSAEGLPRA